MAQEKLVIMVTHGPEDAELATIPFAMAGAVVASDVEVVLGFQAEAVRLMQKGIAEKIEAPEFAPLGELVQIIGELGGKFLVCSPCMKNREIPAEALIDGAEVVAAARFVAEITSATNSLVY